MAVKSVAALTADAGPGFIASLKPYRARSAIAACVLACLAGAPATAQDEGVDPALMADEMQSIMPARERAFIQLLLDARRKYEAASPGAERGQIRLSMQAAVTNFLAGDRVVKDWVGVFRASHTNREGDRWVRIEIAPGVTIGTGQNRHDDPNLLTLIEPHSDNYTALDAIGVGQPVLFTARILAGRLSSDDDMVEQPWLFAHFETLKRAK